MKRILLIALLLLSVKGFAQVTLEHIYPVETYLYEVSPTEWDYCNIQGSTIYIYSIDHSLIESVAAPVSGEYSAVWTLSKGLFTSDGKYVIGYYYYGGSNYGSAVIEDNGTTVIELDSAQSGAFYNTNSGTKLVMPNSYLTGATRVYSLPGTYAAGIPRTQADIMVNSAYPNPTVSMINLPYNLNGNAQGELDVVNMNGQMMRQFKIGSAFNEILLNTGDLPKGSYLYYITTNGQQSQVKQFVVQ